MEKSHSKFAIIAISALLVLNPSLLNSHASSFSVTGQAFEATAVWGSAQSPLVVAPSSTNLPLFITLYDLGPSSAIYGVNVSFTPASPLVPVSGEPQTITQYVPEVTAGQSLVLIGYYDVSPTASPGIYSQSLTVSYANGTISFSQTVQFSIPILGNSRIAVSGYVYNPTFVYPGMTLASLQVYVQNTGSSMASNVSANLLTSFPVSAAYNGSTSAFLGFLPVGTSVPLTFVLSIANTSSAQNTSLTLIISYNGGLLEQFAIPFTEQPKAVLQIQPVSMPTIRIGDGADYLTLEVRNVGTVPVQFAMITMLPSNVFSPSIPSSENPLLALNAGNQSIGAIMPGQTANATYIVQVSSSIEQGTYALNFLLSWRQSGSTAPFVQEVPIFISVHHTLVQNFASYFSDPLVIIVILVLVIALIVVAMLAVRRSGRKRAASREHATVTQKN